MPTSATGLNRRGEARLADHLMRALQCALNPWGPLESASFQGIPHLDNPTRPTRDATISGPLANVREPRGQRHKILRAPKAVQLHGPSLQQRDHGEDYDVLCGPRPCNCTALHCNMSLFTPFVCCLPPKAVQLHGPSLQPPRPVATWSSAATQGRAIARPFIATGSNAVSTSGAHRPKAVQLHGPSLQPRHRRSSNSRHVTQGRAIARPFIATS